MQHESNDRRRAGFPARLPEPRPAPQVNLQPGGQVITTTARHQLAALIWGGAAAALVLLSYVGIEWLEGSAAREKAAAARLAASQAVTCARHP